MFQLSGKESYEEGQVIFEEGSFGDWIYVVEEGSVELSKKVGGKKIVLEVIQPGEIFGEISLLSKSERTATAIAVGETEIGVIDRMFLDDEFNRLSGGFRKILEGLALRLKRTSDSLAQIKMRRDEPRIPKSFSLTFKDRESLIKATSHNISGTGIYIKTPKPLAKGSKFNLKLQLPDDPEPLQIGCNVVWSRGKNDDASDNPVGMGVKFLQIRKKDYLRLKEALK